MSRLEGYALSPQQQEALFNIRAGEAGNIQAVFRFGSELDWEKLCAAVNTVLEQSPVYKLKFLPVPGSNETVQVQETENSVQFEVVEISNEENATEIVRIGSRNANAEVLLKVSRYHTADNLFNAVVFSSSPLCADLWSIYLLTANVFGVYNGGDLLPEPPIDYLQFSEWQNQLLEAPEVAEGKAYWQSRLIASNTPPEIIFCRKHGIARPEVLPFNTMLDEKMTSLLMDHQSREALLAACWYVLIWKLNREVNFMAGHVHHGRGFEQVYHVAGNFSKVVPLQLELDAQSSLSGFVQQYEDALNLADTHKEALEASEQYHRFVKEQLSYRFEYADLDLISDDVRRLPQQLLLPGRQLKLQLQIVKLGNAFRIALYYDSNAYTVTDVEYLLNAWQAVVHQALAGAGIAAGKVSLGTFTGVAESMALPEVSVIDWFNKQAASNAGRPAVTDEAKTLTYAELNQQSAALAKYLLSNGFITGEKRIGIIQPENTSLIIAILAVLKAGGTYVPIDANDSDKRVQHILSDSGVSCILTTSALRGMNSNSGVASIALDELDLSEDQFAIELPQRSPQTPAYIIYTSGTSGLPKGVIITDASLVNYVSWLQQFAGITQEDCGALLSSYAFDLGYTTLWGMLLSGGSLHLMQKERIQDVDFLLNYIVSNNISFLKTTPSFFNVLIRSANAGQLNLAALRLLMLGGEIINADDLILLHTQINPAVKVINHYGPTETTIGTIAHRIDMDALEQYRQLPVIGKPVTNNRVYIIDSNGALAAPGVTGEICIGGKGLATGYLNRPELTDEKFVIHPAVNERIYLTGDTGCRTPEGNILYLGRKDDQVKIRGYRVEPGEVKLAISQYPGIDQAVVAVKGGAYDRQLVAYVTATEQLDVNKIKTFLKQAVPGYMVPAHIVQIKEIPLTANHKVDYKALPDPNSPALAKKAGAQPRNAREADVMKVFREVLNNENIGIDDDFFELGGHSLKAIQVVNRLQKELKIKAAIRDIFNHPTIRGFCESIAGANAPVVQSIEAVPVKDHYELSHSQKRYWLTSQRKASSALSNVPQCCVFRGKLNVDLLQNAFRQLISRHEALRTIFKTVGGEPVQIILPADKVVFSIQQLAASDKDEAAAIINEEIKTAFDLENTIPVRVKLVALAPEEHLLIFTLHHIISDGWTRGIIYRELMQFYEDGYHKKPVSLPPLRIQYKDYVSWHNKIYREQEPYWSAFFQQGIADNNFPLDHKRPETLTFEGDVHAAQLDKETLQKLKQLVGQHKLTLNSLMLGIYGLMLGEYCRSNEVVVGSLVSGRNHLDLENIVGVFINFLPFRISVNKETDFISYIRSVNADLVQAYQHQDYPFDLMVDKFYGNVKPNRNPVFDTMMIFHDEENSVFQQELAGGVKLEKFEDFSREYLSRLDFKIDVTTNEDGINLRLEYNKNLFRPGTMQLLLDRYVRLLLQATENTTIALKELPVLAETGQQIDDTVKRTTANAMRVVASFTAEPLEDHLSWWLEAFEQHCSIQFAPFNQVFQQLLSVGKNKAAQGEICVLMNRFEDYAQDAEAIDTLNMVFDKLQKLVAEVAAMAPVILVVTPPSDAMPDDEVKQHIRQLNEASVQLFRDKENVYLIDLRNYSRMHPGLNLFDDISYQHAYIPFSDEGFYFIAYHINRVYWSLKGNACKVIALDCDNTLWEGICGEDNLEGIRIREGHRALQEYFIRKYEEGFLLVLVSKNNEKDVWNVFSNHPGMLLKKEHFAGWRINWEPKPANIWSLAKQLNLGVDSFAFIDDNPVECFQMMQDNPQVLTLELPPNHLHIPNFLDQVISFDKLKISKEDAARNEMYKAEVLRNESLKDVELSAFLDHLQLEMSFCLMKEEELERVAQLTMRTNQFNLNGIRRSKQEILHLLENEAFKCYVVHVRDRFGDYGLTGAILLEQQTGSLVLHSFMLSCRVLGRGIEEAILGVLRQMARTLQAESVAAMFRQTERNIPFSEFLIKTGWNKNPEHYSIAANNQQADNGQVKIYINEDLPAKQKVAVAEKQAVNGVAVPQPSNSSAEEMHAWVWKKNLCNEENLAHRHVYKALEFGNLEFFEQMKQQQLQALAQDFTGDLPADETTATVLKLFREVLKNGKVTVDDDFFSAGGHSIKAVKLLSKFYQVFGVNISLASFFELGTAKLVAEEISRQRSLDEWIDQAPVGDGKSYDEIII